MAQFSVRQKTVGTDVYELELVVAGAPHSKKLKVFENVGDGELVVLSNIWGRHLGYIVRHDDKDDEIDQESLDAIVAALKAARAEFQSIA